MLKCFFWSLLFVSSFSLANGFDDFFKESEYQVKLGGWSYHMVDEKKEPDLNEVHNGFGLSMVKDGSVDNYFFGTNFFDSYSYDFWYMEDSFFKDEIQGGVSFYSDILSDIPVIESVQFSLSTGVMNRSVSRVYNGVTGEVINTETKTFPFAIPGLIIHLTEHFHIDLAYVPKVKGISSFNTFFLRAGISLN